MSPAKRTRSDLPPEISDSTCSPRLRAELEQKKSSRLRPGYQRHRSSPSFVESYARYFERLQQDEILKQKAGEDSSKAQASEEDAIRASFPGPPSPQAEAESSRNSSPGIVDTVWEGRNGKSGASVNCPNQAAESLPSSPTHEAQDSTEWQTDLARFQESPRRRDSSVGGGSVAAAIEALEQRSRPASVEVSPSRLQQCARSPSKAVAIFCRSPWPEPDYIPEELNSGMQGPASPSNTERTGSHGRGPSMSAMETCNQRLAQVLDGRPELRKELMGILADDSSQDNEALKLKVQDLLKDHPDLVTMLNAQFRGSSMETGRVRDALYSSASAAAMYQKNWRRESLRAAHHSRHPSTQSYSTGHYSIGPARLKSKPQSDKMAAVSLWTRVLGILVPPPRKRYTPWCTFVVIAAVICIFFFMAGSYASYPEEQAQEQRQEGEPYNPADLRRWMSFSADEQYRFSFDYLLLWGGQYLPAIRQHQGWRWITAAFLHVDFQHMLANMLLLAVVGGLLERRYGTVRIAIMLILSTLGAAFFSGSFADDCTQIVGASGAVMGFVGLTIADLAVNSGDTLQVLLRLAIIFGAVAFFIVTAVTKAKAYTSTWSHLGGFVCGLFPGFLFIPDFQDPRWQTAQKLAAKLRIADTQSTPEDDPCSKQHPSVCDHEDEDYPQTMHVDLSGGVAVEASTLHPIMPFADSKLNTRSNGFPPPATLHEEEPAGNELGCLPQHRPLKSRDWTPRDLEAQLQEGEIQPESPGPHQRVHLFTEARSDGGHLDTHMPTLHSRGPSLAGSALRMRTRARTWWRAVFSTPLHLWLGAFALIGVFSALPTYIYVKHLPEIHCSIS